MQNKKIARSIAISWMYVVPVFHYISLAVLLTACDQQKKSGIIKDFDTGLTANYRGMQPASVFLVMNNEVLGHTDIPIGESFQLVNEGIEGMIERDGYVSAGCSLKISDKKGKTLMEVKDLFTGKDLFKKEAATRLRCTINTGAPMEWEEHYNVQVVFWDKYGAGKISNEFSIRAIDIP